MDEEGAGRAWGLLAHAPYLVPFRERAKLFQAVVAQVGWRLRGYGLGWDSGGLVVMAHSAAKVVMWRRLPDFRLQASLSTGGTPGAKHVHSCSHLAVSSLHARQERARYRDMELMQSFAAELGVGGGNRFFPVRRTQVGRRAGVGAVGGWATKAPRHMEHQISSAQLAEQPLQGAPRSMQECDACLLLPPARRCWKTRTTS